MQLPRAFTSPDAARAATPGWLVRRPTAKTRLQRGAPPLEPSALEQRLRVPVPRRLHVLVPDPFLSRRSVLDSFFLEASDPREESERRGETGSAQLGSAGVLATHMFLRPAAHRTHAAPLRLVRRWYRVCGPCYGGAGPGGGLHRTGCSGFGGCMRPPRRLVVASPTAA